MSRSRWTSPLLVLLGFILGMGVATGWLIEDGEPDGLPRDFTVLDNLKAGGISGLIQITLLFLALLLGLFGLRHWIHARGVYFPPGTSPADIAVSEKRRVSAPSRISRLRWGVG